MKKYDTPYGKKTAGLLILSMDAYCRESQAARLIQSLSQRLLEYAPMDANHEGIENCGIVAEANAWLEKRKSQIQIAENHPEIKD